MARTVLIGIGNPYRRDDGVGPALVAEVDRLGAAGVVLACTDGEPSQLLDAWADAELAVVVDAVACTPATPGRIHRTDLTMPYTLDAHALIAGQPGSAASTHGLGVPDAIRLAVALDQAPKRLVVYAVEAADLGFGTGLSRPVAACLPELARVVLAALTPAGRARR